MPLFHRRPRQQPYADDLAFVPGFEEEYPPEADQDTHLYETERRPPIRAAVDETTSVSYHPKMTVNVKMGNSRILTSEHPVVEPLKWWRENVMPKVTSIPTALLTLEGSAVAEGDLFPVGDRAAGRRVKLLSSAPDGEGNVSVQETYKIKPEAIGLQIRPETVVLELSRAEAESVVKFFHDSQGSGTAPSPGTDALPVLDELASTVRQ